MGDATHERIEPPVAVLDDLDGDLVVAVGGGRARARGVLEGVGRGEACLLDNVESGLEVLLGLAGEADDDVGGDGGLGHNVPDLVQDAQEALGAVGAAHGAQHPVRAGLQGHVQAGHDGLGGGHGLDDVVGEGGGVRTGEAHALDALDGAGRPQQLGEGTAVPEADPVGVDVLAQKSHLDSALRGDGLDLGQDVAGAAVALLAAQGWHDAEGAGVVAAHGDGDPGGVGGLAAGGQGGGEDLERLLELDGGRGVVPGALEQGGQDVEVVGAEDDVDPGGPLDDPLPHLLGQAPGHGDLHAGALALDGGELAQVAEEPGGGVLTHGTGVDDDDVGPAVTGVGGAGGGLGHVLDAQVAGPLQQPRHVLGVVDVHLAAERAHVVGARPVASGVENRCGGGERGHRGAV